MRVFLEYVSVDVKGYLHRIHEGMSRDFRLTHCPVCHYLLVETADFVVEMVKAALGLGPAMLLVLKKSICELKESKHYLR